MGSKRQWEIIEANTSWSNEYHFAAAAVWCALGFNVRLLISRFPEAKADGVLCLVIVVEGSSFLMTWKNIK